ncbi:MAG: YqaE/Pmp3 family membrane protein [Oculatellaceae cyanobacterium Prado106]|jgi:uncharacterized membrane protein YqaE (UPF0057 family)|nr:YqaE/Pmp3 family membrane protein [Oculatellaceae cyanobacterium Prado106]
MKLIRLILSIVFPPAAIFLTYGISSTLLINIALTFLGYVPGIIHALWAIAKHDENTNQSKGTV